MTYVVKSGDSLSKILKNLGVSGYANPAVWNLIRPQLRSGNPSLIYPGETLDLSVLPEFAAPAPAPAPAPQPVAPAPAPTPVVNPVVDLARRYTDPLTGKVKKASEIPQFETLLNWNQAWQRFEDPATAMAEQQIKPEALRQYNQAYENYMGNLVNTGGQRFGRGFDGGGMGGVGSLKAASERGYQGQMQDWLNAIKGGFTDLWYNPSAESWNKGKLTVDPGQKFGESPKLPSWEELYGDISQKYGIGGSGGSSLLYS